MYDERDRQIEEQEEELRKLDALLRDAEREATVRISERDAAVARAERSEAALREYENDAPCYASLWDCKEENTRLRAAIEEALSYRAWRPAEARLRRALEGES